MSRRFNPLLNYKEMQIIKHSLQRSIEYKKEHRPEDVEEEEKLLAEIEEMVNEFKDRYNVKPKRPTAPQPEVWGGP